MSSKWPSSNSIEKLEKDTFFSICLLTNTQSGRFEIIDNRNRILP